MKNRNQIGESDHSNRVATVEALLVQAGMITHGLTTAEVARRYRVGEDKVRGWIKAGKLKALNTNDPLQKPRFVVLPEHLAEFERERSTVPLPKTERRKRKPETKDYYPD